jgi:hypothetical protein
MEDTYREHKGHRVELRGDGPALELRIDGEPVAYDRAPDGRYFLNDYAYDPADDLMDLALRYLDYRERADAIRSKASAS